VVLLHRANLNVTAAAQSELRVVLESCIVTVILADIAGGICVSNYKNVFLQLDRMSAVCIYLYRRILVLSYQNKF